MSIYIRTFWKITPVSHMFVEAIIPWTKWDLIYANNPSFTVVLQFFRYNLYYACGLSGVSRSLFFARNSKPSIVPY